MKEAKIFVVNPGSTSTKVALFVGEEKIFSADISHNIEELKKCRTIQEQFPERINTITQAINENHLDMQDVDAFACRAGGLCGLKGGIYNIEEGNLIHQVSTSSNRHPNVLGPALSVALAKTYAPHAKVYTVNPPDTDELIDLERITGFNDTFRESRGHPLNQKENCIRYAESMGKTYKDMNFIVAHMGGGVTVGAHRHGQLISCNDCLCGDGPMAPTRSGWVPPTDIVRMCFSGKYTEDEIKTRISKRGGFTDHLNTADTREIEKMIEEGNEYAKLVYDAFIYQVGKAIGGCAAVLEGKADAIILTGGISKSHYVTENVKKYVSWIAPVVVQAGEFEMEALAHGAMRALSGQEEVLEFTGKPVFDGFHCKGAPKIDTY